QLPHPPHFPYTTLFRSRNSGAPRPLREDARRTSLVGLVRALPERASERQQSGGGRRRRRSLHGGGKARCRLIHLNRCTPPSKVRDRQSTRLNSSHVSTS